MQCPNCGSPLDTSGLSRYATCEYCKAKIAVVGPQAAGDGGLSWSSPTILRRLEVAAVDLEGGNYPDALAAYEEILKLEPDCWPALLNKALCLFWLGREDMTHFSTVKAILHKAAVLSDNHPDVLRTQEDIAFNLCAIGSAAEFVGDRIQWALKCFDLSREITADHALRDEAMSAWCANAVRMIRSRLERELANRRKHFDPPMSDLQTLYRVATLESPSSSEAICLCLALAQFRARRRPTPELAALRERATAFKAGRFADIPELTVAVPLIGTARITHAISTS